MSNVETATASTTESREPQWDRPYAIPNSIINIWGGMKGEIVVMHPTWYAARALEIFKERLKTAVRNRQVALSEEEQKKFAEISPLIIDRMVEHENLLYEGDIIAVDHVVSQLRYLYDPQKIRVQASTTFGSKSKELKVNRKLMRLLERKHLVCVGGPPSNLVADIMLQEAGLDWLYDEEKEEIAINPDSEDRLRYSEVPSDSGETFIDHGVFLKCDNPYNRSKRMYVLMGIHSYGTQGAAALACNIGSADELTLIGTDDEPVTDKVKIYNLAWTKVLREAREDKREVTPSNVKYFIVHPKKEDGCEWKEHRNPSLIRESQHALRYQIFRPTYFLGARPSALMLHFVLLLVQVISYFIVLFTKSNSLHYVFLVLLLLCIIGTTFSFFQLCQSKNDNN
jgi:hypothetical protein